MCLCLDYTGGLRATIRGDEVTVKLLRSALKFKPQGYLMRHVGVFSSSTAQGKMLTGGNLEG